MATTQSEWPRKTRELHNHHFDSTIWNGFKFRDDDIIIASYAKSGTTWLQQIVGQLVFDGREGVNVAELSPWLDLRVPPKEIKVPAVEAQTHRRFIKTHLPVDALVFSPKAKYIYIARDGRDVVWSMYNHHANANQAWYDALNKTLGLVGAPIEPPSSSVSQYFDDWLERDGHPFWPFWENIRTWWEIRDLPNVMLLHYSDLRSDLPGEVQRIATFLNIRADDACLAKLQKHCSFDYMKKNAALHAPLGGVFWEGGAQTFVNKGTNGRWRDTLTPTQCEAYETRERDELGPACAAWLRNGRRALVD